MSKVTSKPKKRKSKANVLQPAIVRRSNEEVCLNYLIMRSRSKTLKSTIQDIFNLAPLRFKNLEKLQKALDKLQKHKCVTFESGEYLVTDIGLNMRNMIAERKRRSVSARD